MHTYLYMYMYTYIDVCIYLYLYLYTCIYTHVCLYIYMICQPGLTSFSIVVIAFPNQCGDIGHPFLFQTSDVCSFITALLS